MSPTGYGYLGFTGRVMKLFKALTLAPRREDRHGIFIAYSLEVAESDELPRALKVAPCIDVDRER